MVRMPVAARRARVTGPDAPHQLDRQGMEEGRFPAGWHHDQPVGLGHLGGDLGQVLGAGDSDGDGQTDLGPHPVGGWRPAMVGGGAEEVDRPGDVEEGLVDGDPLDERREVPAHGHDLIAEPLVLAEVAADEAAAPGRAGGPATRACRPGTPNALASYEAARTTPPPTAIGRPLQRRVEQLLDRRVERVEVSVQDRGLPVRCHRPQHTRTYVRYPRRESQPSSQPSGQPSGRSSPRQRRHRPTRSMRWSSTREPGVLLGDPGRFGQGPFEAG